MYYVYSKRSGRLLMRTTDRTVLNKYLPSLVDVHYSH